MSLSDPVSDMLTAIRNGQRVKLASVETPSSTLRKHILDVLQEEGYISGYEVKAVRKGVEKLVIALRYHEGRPVITEISRVSKPGRRTYASSGDVKKVYNGLGLAILSTSKGVMPDYKARAANVGGEVLCNVF